MSSLKIIFAGTPAFAATALQALLQSPHHVIAVFTQPDRPAGRGLKLTPSAVKQLALDHQLLLHQPASLKNENEQKILADLNADVMVVAAYGMLLPAAVLSLPHLGCVNIHPSLLPRWRGAAPIQRTIYAGDTKTGVTIMKMDEGLDTGPILYQEEYLLTKHETSKELHDKLADMGARCLIKTLDLLADNKITPQAQDNQLATYAQKIMKEEAFINWEKTAEEIDHAVRAFNPWPVAYTSWQGQSLRIWKTKVLTENHHLPAGTLVRASSEGMDVAAGSNVIRILEMQLPGGKILTAENFYHAYHDKLPAGQRLI
jgi:methionyl-tRNA formyltransferase